MHHLCFLASHSSAHARYTSITDSLRRNLAPEERFIVKLKDILVDLPGQLGKLSDFLGIARIDYSSVNPARKSNVTEALPIPPRVLERLRSALASELTFYDTAGRVGPYLSVEHGETVGCGRIPTRTGARALP